MLRLRRLVRGSPGARAPSRLAPAARLVLLLSSDHDTLLVGKKKRAPVEEDVGEIAYLIYGRFAEDEDEPGFNDKRWVVLQELVENDWSTEDLQPLLTYEKELEKRMKVAKQKLMDFHIPGV